MKNRLLLFVIMVFTASVTNTGCSSPGGDIILPDISSLKIQSVSSFVPGGYATVSLYSTSLSGGIYTVHYTLTGANAVTNQSTAFVMTNDTGSFETITLPNPGNTTLTINEITTTSGGNATIYHNNTQVFTDSIGLMTATIGTKAYKATHVTASVTDHVLTIKGLYWTTLATISLYVNDYTQHTGPVSFNAMDITTNNGSAVYSVSTTSLQAQHGTINITATSPLITGTFSFTNTDSSTVSSGTFSCPAP